LALLGCWLPAAAAQESDAARPAITVAVASSLYPAMQEQARRFEQTHHVRIRLVAGSTGRLYNQIMQGAPFDLFIAADTRRPALLAGHGRSLEQIRIGSGYLGVRIGARWVDDPARLLDPAIRHIVIANPDVAPFGMAARQLLRTQRLWQRIRPRLVFARNALQASMMVDKGIVDAGIIPSFSDSLSASSVPYIAVLLRDRQLARQWMDRVALIDGQRLALYRR
jgi:molybdate transport system substrate-binding protein